MPAKVITFEYLPKQKEFMDAVDRHPFTAYIGGVGSGKTHTLCFQALREASIPNTVGLLGAPTYRMLYDVTMRKFFELCPPEWIEDRSITRNTVKLKNGSEVLFRSFENADALQGHNLDWFGGDEMGLVAIDAFRQMQARLRKPGGRHKGFIVGNPAGPTHWTYEYFVVKASEYPDVYSLTRATSYENDFLEQSYTQEMERSFGKDSLYFRRFVLAEFVAFEGAYWPNFNIMPYPNGHVIIEPQDALKVLKPQTEAKWTFGRVLDFGFEHPFVLMWWVHDGETIVFYDEYYKRHATIREHLYEIRKREAIHKQWFGVHRPQVAWTDHDAQGRYEIQNCTDYEGNYIGFTCSPADKTKFVMESIMGVQSLIERNKIYITSRCEHAKLEIPSYRAKPLDKTDKEQPIKENDDTCDCIRMACWMEMKHMFPFVRHAMEQSPDKFADFRRITNEAQNVFNEYGPQSL